MERLNDDQLQAYEIIMSGINTFITGAGGCGKSFLVKVLIEKFEAMGKIVGVTSTTGISALPLRGKTIHSWAGIGLGDKDALELLKKVRRNSKAKKNWLISSVLIIDEISMMPPDLFTKLEFIGRAIRGNQLPFGGIQILVSGDMAQLPPVKTDSYCFNAVVWDTTIQYVAHLKKNMRQKEELFQRVLNNVRFGIVNDEVREVLSSRVNANVGTELIKPTKLFSLKVDVEEVNQQELRKLLSPENNVVRYRARDDYKAPNILPKETLMEYTAYVNKNCQGREVLDLAVGAQVMLIVNLDVDAGLVNGSRGVVIRFEEHRPVVRFMNGLEIIVAAHIWEIEINEYVTAIRFQVPLILSYSLTTHKCQGATLDCVDLDLGDSIFAAGQFYTALSRVRTLEGLSISELNFDKIIADPQVVEYYSKFD